MEISLWQYNGHLDAGKSHAIGAVRLQGRIIPYLHIYPFFQLLPQRQLERIPFSPARRKR